MDGRFLGVPPSSRLPAYYYSVPARRQPPAMPPKVVSIPVHFVEPEPARTRTRSREELVVKMQAAIRGFVVRKYVKKLDAVRREVGEIERRVCEEKMADILRRDERERLKVNEALMSLLFRLDSVRGVDAGVRDLRKRVIRKAIALQEKVDAIAAAADLADRKDGGAAEEEEDGTIDSTDLPCPGEEDTVADQIDRQAADLTDQVEERRVAQGEETVLELPVVELDDALNLMQEYDEAGPRNDHLDSVSPTKEDGRAEANQIVESDHVINKVNDVCDPIMQMEPSQFESYAERRSDASLDPDSFLEEVDENTPMKEEDNEAEQATSTKEKELEAAADGKDHKANNRNEEMLRRMMEDNDKMMTLMMQLSERNERQTQLLSLLSQRVERLEKAFLCEKIRRKKNKREATAGDRMPNASKSGKKL